MFMIHTTDDGHLPGTELLPASAMTPKLGMALTMSAGKLAIASGTTTPTYICMCERKEACAAGDLIPVVRVNHDMIFETTFSAAATSIVPGTKVTLHTDGLSVTATTTSGVAEVVEMLGAASGDAVRVRF